MLREYMFEDDERCMSYNVWYEKCLEEEKEKITAETTYVKTIQELIEQNRALTDENQRLRSLAGMAVLDFGPFRWLFGG